MNLTTFIFALSWVNRNLFGGWTDIRHARQNCRRNCTFWHDRQECPVKNQKSICFSMSILCRHGPSRTQWQQKGCSLSCSCSYPLWGSRCPTRVRSEPVALRLTQRLQRIFSLYHKVVQRFHIVDGGLPEWHPKPRKVWISGSNCRKDDKHDTCKRITYEV